MLDIKIVREDPEKVKRALKDRNLEFDLSHILDIDDGRRALIKKVEDLRAEKNRLAKEVPIAQKEGKDIGELVAESKEVGEHLKHLDGLLKEHEEELAEKIAEIPNIPADGVPVGESEEDNVEIRTWGKQPDFEFEPKGHWDIGTDLGILDFERGAKVTGARFTVTVGAGARLERALMNYMLDMHTGEHGYKEVFPPILVNEDSLFATGQLPKLREDMYAVTDDLFLIPTAEVPVTNLHRNEIIPAGDMPIKYVAYSPCFRREAGSYGRETRGLIRQHQFNKVEMVRFVEPDNSPTAHEELTAQAEAVLQGLGLAYRVVELCTADLSFAAAKCYDLEVWMPGMGGYVEISSCSNFSDFQARRSNVRFKGGDGKTRYPHTLNGSGLAIGRTVAAVLENYQRQDGSVSIPPALVEYMGNSTIIAAQG